MASLHGIVIKFLKWYTYNTIVNVDDIVNTFLKLTAIYVYVVVYRQQQCVNRYVQVHISIRKVCMTHTTSIWIASTNNYKCERITKNRIYE